MTWRWCYNHFIDLPRISWDHDPLFRVEVGSSQARPAFNPLDAAPGLAKATLATRLAKLFQLSAVGFKLESLPLAFAMPQSATVGARKGSETWNFAILRRQ